MFVNLFCVVSYPFIQTLPHSHLKMKKQHMSKHRKKNVTYV